MCASRLVNIIIINKLASVQADMERFVRHRTAINNSFIGANSLI